MVYWDHNAPNIADNTIRFSIGRDPTESEVRHVVKMIKNSYFETRSQFKRGHHVIKKT